MSDLEADARALAEKHGYRYGILTDGTVLLEPPPDPECCGMCASRRGPKPAVDMGELDDIQFDHVLGKRWQRFERYIAGYLDGSSRATGGGSWR